MNSGLKSKGIFFVILSIGIGASMVGFALYATHADAQKGKNSSQNTSAGELDRSKIVETAQNTLAKNSAQDSDGDGLLNWEESLWGTNPNNPDTDGDGTSDGVEVKAGRNPLKPGPNDQIAGMASDGKSGSSSKKGVSAADNSQPADNTETGQISREVFANYMIAKRSGAPLTADLQTRIIGEALKNKSIGVQAKEYSAQDVFVVGSDFKKYGNALGLAFLAGASTDRTSEIDILQSALIGKHPEEIVKLDPIIADYEAILNKLASIAVPEGLVNEHVDLLNNIGNILADIKDFREMFDDPVVGSAGIGRYVNDSAALQSSIRKISAAFGNQGVTFDKTETGYVFVNSVH